MLFYFACEAAGALGARHSLRPLFSDGGSKEQNSGEIAPREREVVAVVIARLDRAIQYSRDAND
jgi:hypothetical protein